MTDKEIRDPDMKKAKIMAVIAIVLFFVAFAVLGIGAVLQENGVSDRIVIPTALIGFFGCDIAAIILLIKVYPTLLLSDCIKMDEFYEKRESDELCLPDREALAQSLLVHKFKPTEDGGYRKKKFSGTVLVIAVDSRNSRGYFMDIKKRNLSLYSYGCSMVKRLFRVLEG